MDINEPRVYDAAFMAWILSLEDNDRHQIYSEIVERYYPDGFNGFVNDAWENRLQLGSQAGI